MSEQQRKFAVFDIDGTLFRSHLYWEVALAMARQDNLHPSINKKALELYDAWQRRSSKLAFEDFDGQTIEAIDGILEELNPADYDAVLNVALPPLLDHTYMYTKDLLVKLKADGYFILAISGSRLEEVTLFAKYHGFDDWIGQQYERSADGRLKPLPHIRLDRTLEFLLADRLK